MKDFKGEVAKKLFDLNIGLELEEIMLAVEIPTDSKMGDYAFPCFKLAKALRKAPPIIAAELAEKLVGDSLFLKVENVNAYVNFFIDKKVLLQEVLSETLSKKENFGKSDLGQGKKVLVEFSSPNIMKPFHIGHIRTTVIGNSVYKIMAALGYDTVRINHLGDYGTQFGKMIVAFRKWGSREVVEKSPIKEMNTLYVKFHEEVETDPSLDDEARAVFKALEDGSPEEFALWKWFRDESLKEFERVYEMLDIEFDSYAGESFYSDKMPAALETMISKGILKDSEGAKVVDLEEYNLGTALIQKKDGSTLYSTRDVAAAIYRKETYDFYKNLYIVGSQQNLHFAQWKKIVELMGYEWANDCVHIPFGMVALSEGTMSTRKGRVVYLEDVLNGAVEKTKEIILEKKVNTEAIDQSAKEIGIGAVIFQELSNNMIKDYVFDWNKVLNFEGETGPYVQYTHARACSVLRNADMALTADVDYSFLTGDSAYELTKLIYAYPAVVIEAGEKYEPSIITRHIVDVAQGFNRFYHDEHILVENEAEKKAKILLVYAAKTTIANGLALLGIHAPEKM